MTYMPLICVARKSFCASNWGSLAGQGPLTVLHARPLGNWQGGGQSRSGFDTCVVPPLAEKGSVSILQLKAGDTEPRHALFLPGPKLSRARQPFPDQSHS
ncbi:unnamed protein product [Lota lota]